MVWLRSFERKVNRLALNHVPTAKSAKENRPLRVLYLAAFFPGNAGYHYRVKQWADILEQRGIEVKIENLYSDEEFQVFVHDPKFRLPMLRLGMERRLEQILNSTSFDVVIVRRELTLYNDYANACLDRLLLKLHPNAILDFDDNISAAKNEPRPLSQFGRMAHESPSKFKDLLGMYQRFMVGSKVLQAFTLQHHPNLKTDAVQIIPTCVDYDDAPPKVYVPASTTVIGWIGSNTNQVYLDRLVEPLNRLAEQHAFEFHCITGTAWEPQGANFEVKHIPWSLTTQIESMKAIDIGLMPIDHTPIGEGKCGFKLIQYMGLGIVGIASAVGANLEILNDGVNGALVPSEDQWYTALEQLLLRKKDFATIGEAARQTVLERYSFSGNTEAYLDFIRKTAEISSATP